MDRNAWNVSYCVRRLFLNRDMLAIDDCIVFNDKRSHKKCERLNASF